MRLLNRRCLAPLAVALGAIVPLRAQQVLYAEYQDKYYPVRKVHNGWVTVQVDGRPVDFIAKHSALEQAEEYLPVLVAVKEVDAHTTGLTTWQGGNFNNHFAYSAEFTSPTALSDVFFVLELNSEAVGKRIIFEEVG